MLCRNASDGSAVPHCPSKSSGGWQQAGSVRDPNGPAVFSSHSPSPFEQLGDLVYVLQGATFAVSTVEGIAT